MRTRYRISGSIAAAALVVGVAAATPANAEWRPPLPPGISVSGSFVAPLPPLPGLPRGVVRFGSRDNGYRRGYVRPYTGYVAIYEGDSCPPEGYAYDSYDSYDNGYGYATTYPSYAYVPTYRPYVRHYAPRRYVRDARPYRDRHDRHERHGDRSW
jgi:hypothetical protein